MLAQRVARQPVLGSPATRGREEEQELGAVENQTLRGAQMSCLLRMKSSLFKVYSVEGAA